MNNKKGVEGGAMTTVVALVILLFAAFILIGLTSKQGGQIKDAGDEMMSFTNLMNPNCDFDHDGISGGDDQCPCDHDGVLDSKTYYLIGSQCGVNMIEKVFPEKLGENEIALEKETLYDYSISTIGTKTDCIESLISIVKDDANKICIEYPAVGKTAEKTIFMSKFKLDVGQSVSSLTKKIASENKDDRVIFADSCATKILALHKETGRLTFTCKTATKDCKKKLASSKC